MTAPNIRPFVPRKRGKAAEKDGAPPEPPPPSSERKPCPIAAIGHADGVYWFTTAKGELLSFTYRNLYSKGAIAALFDGRIDRGSWVWDTFPRMSKEGDDQVGISVDACAGYLVRACADAGMIDPGMPLRGRGVWRDGDGLIVHCGDGVLIDGQWQRPGVRRRGAIYRATVAAARPADEPGGPDLADALRESVSLWNWQQPAAPEILIGWIAAALLGAALRWRAHLLVCGERGSGKTWLFNLVEAALGTMGVGANGFSEAGLRQALSSEARAVLLDEAEGDHAGGRVQRAIELLRLMSSGAGARVLRGSAGGQAQRFDVAGAAYLSAINPPQLQPQDESRITRLDLNPLDSIGSPDAALAAITTAVSDSPKLWSRMIAGLDRFAENFAAWRAGLVARGCDARQAEQPATILAGWSTLSSDVAIRRDEVAAELADGRFDFVIRTVASGADETGAQLCWQTLLSSPLDVWRGGERTTIGRLLGEARNASATDARRSLATFGIIVGGEAIAARVVVANRHQALARLFAGTQWADGKWRDELRRLPGGAKATEPEWFGGAKSRGTEIPVEHLPPASRREEPTDGG